MTRISRSVLLSFMVATTLAGNAKAQKAAQLSEEDFQNGLVIQEAIELDNAILRPVLTPRQDSLTTTQRITLSVSGDIRNHAPLRVRAVTEFAIVMLGKSESDAIVAVVPTGAISGKVTHADGVTPISGATIKALQGVTTIATTTTNGIGDYTLPQLAAGSYTIEASASGFGTKNQSLVTVTESGTTTVNLRLDAIVSGPVSYIYDALGRLVATVGPTETSIYSYDAVGNLLSISLQPSTQLSIITVVPSSGSVGQMVTIYGSGFSAVLNGNNVQFNGVAAGVISATSTRIITTVPSLGLTGPIQIAVTTSQGTVTAPFTVLAANSGPSIEVAPRYISILPGNTLQFFANITGLAGDQSLTWSVNGVVGGNSDLGTISSSGFYSSPNQPASIFAIRATSVANPAVFGQAQVAILNPSYSQALISGAISVLHQPTIKDSAISTAVSVRRKSSDSVAPVAQVSVRRLSPTDTAAPIATSVSIHRRDASTSASTQSASVSLTTGPVIQSLSPASAAKGTSFTLTINGANFDGATGLSFLTTGGAVDSAITASSVSVNANGTALTATITISAGAALGQRVVIVATPTSHSLAVNVGPNVLEIIQ